MAQLPRIIYYTAKNSQHLLCQKQDLGDSEFYSWTIDKLLKEGFRHGRPFHPFIFYMVLEILLAPGLNPI